MRTDVVMLRRFVQESLGRIPPDLRGWAMQGLFGSLAFEDRIAERNRAILAAADLLPPGMSVTDKARALSADLRLVRRSPRPADPDMTTVRGCLAHALLVCDRPLSQKQVFRVLTKRTVHPLKCL